MFTQGRRSGVLLSALAVSFAFWLPAQAASPVKHTVRPVKTSQTDNQLADSETSEVKMNPNLPVIPLAAERPVSTDNLSLSDAKQALNSLMEAQTKMMQQIQVLQARIEKTEQDTATNTVAITATAQQAKASSSILDDWGKHVKLNGYAEMGWRTYTHPAGTEEYLDAAESSTKHGNTFDMRRFVLQPKINFTDKASWYGEIEFEDAGLDEITLEESVFNYAWKPALNIKGGLMVLPYTYTSYNHAGYQRLLVDRPLVDNYIIPSTYRDLGAGITGTIPVGKRGGLNYELDVLNGLNDTLASDLAQDDVSNGIYNPVSGYVDFAGLHSARPSTGDANSHFRDNNTSKQLFGHLGYSPFPNLNMSVSASTGKIGPNNQEALNVISGDIFYRIKKWSFLGEFATDIFAHASGLSSQGIPFSLYPRSMKGFFAQAAYDITPKLTSVAAYNYVDLDSTHTGNKMQRLSLGLRYNPFNNVYLKTEYQVTTPRKQFGSQERLSNALLTQLTFYMQ